MWTYLLLGLVLILQVAIPVIAYFLLRNLFWAQQVEREQAAQQNQLAVIEQLTTLQANLDKLIQQGRETTERNLRVELSAHRQESANSAGQLRGEVAGSLKQFGDIVQQRMADSAQNQRSQLDIFSTRLSQLTQSNEAKLEALRQTIEQKLTQLQQENAAKLDQMRQTVDEKLQGVLEKRLGESFKLVSERLEQVHKGLGEMQNLAVGVGDLKRVLTNVKTRGTWGEVLLASLLEQVLTPEQYAVNVVTRPGSSERVEFAIRLPGRDDHDKTVWLPLDSKYPQEDHQRLLDAQEKGDITAANAAGAQLESKIRAFAKDIRDKYLEPPHTTDFGLMFLPNEGLYAEVLRRPKLVESLQQDLRIVITGPTTLAALLNSLQMGFRTLAIQKRSAEVWQVLGAVKTEFGKFGDALALVKSKLEQASSSIEKAETRTRQIERKLRTVERLPADQAQTLLPQAAMSDHLPDDDSPEDT